MAERSRTRKVPEKRPPFSKSSLFFVFITVVTIFAVFKFTPKGESGLTSSEIPRSDLQMFDEGLWPSMYRIIAHYSDIKATGYKLESGRVKAEDTTLFCDESQTFLLQCRETITKLVGEEERGGIPEYTQTSLAFLDAVGEATRILKVEAERLINQSGSGATAELAEFLAQTQNCDTLMAEFREARVVFLTPTGLSENQLKSKIDVMDTLIRSAG